MTLYLLLLHAVKKAPNPQNVVRIANKV